ncbi:hypothetical protein Tco_1516584 [Tanacetum coccineum]
MGFTKSFMSDFQCLLCQLEDSYAMGQSSFDDLYKQSKSLENDVKGSTASSSNLQNVAFVSENTNSTNDVSTAYDVSNTSGHNSKHEQTSSYSLLAIRDPYGMEILGNKDGKRTEKREESRALVTVDGESVDWTTHSEDDEL